ncbi:hypothetical protein [Paenibacillus tengchongensis]|uniref:hypothetical protein n=1 Tax=Paenibacillus tengchongensis TaxID=2608684 RepID=UPI00124F0D40|nr:hypothetical protein [Paenibacillus tengchongensis]
MVANADRAVMALIILAAAVFAIYRIYVWLQKSPGSYLKDRIPLNDEIEPHPALEILEGEGYEVVGGKLKIPLVFTLDGSSLYSRLFIDYVAARNEDSLYLVILSRPRKMLEFTGSGLRDALLPYLLIYPECSGVLYVDTAASAVHLIRLGRDDGESD